MGARAVEQPIPTDADGIEATLLSRARLRCPGHALPRRSSTPLRHQAMVTTAHEGRDVSRAIRGDSNLAFEIIGAHGRQFLAGHMGQHAVELGARRDAVGTGLEAQLHGESNVSVQMGHGCLLVLGSHLNDN